MSRQAVSETASNTGLLYASPLPRWSKLLVLIAALGWVCALMISLRDIHQYPGVDLRLKVVGARALADGYDPYDPGALPQNNEYFKTNGVPYNTPALLLLYEPLRNLAFTAQRAVYYWLDWAFAVAIFYVLQRDLFANSAQRSLCWVIFSAFVICGSSFRLHLERGQYYMLLLLLMSLSASAINANRAGILSCLPAALLILLRPTYLLMVLAAIFALKRTKWGIRVIAIAALLFLFTLPQHGFQRWIEFLHATQDRQAEHLQRLSPVDQQTRPGPQKPLMIEGQDFSKTLPDTGLNGTLIGVTEFVFNSSSRLSATLQKINLAPWMKKLNTAGLVLSLMAGVLIIRIASRRAGPGSILLAIAFLWPILIEFFGPERFFYTTVIEVLPLLFVLLCNDCRTDNLWKTLWILAIFPTLIELNSFIKVPLANSVLCVAVSILLPIALAVYCTQSILKSPRLANSVS